VEASACRIRQYRYAEARMMRILGGWIALTPELPVKLLFGRHVWDCAQHADLWGRRLPELRAHAQEPAPANERFVTFMDLLDGREAPPESIERVVGIYRVLKPHLVATYEAHLAEAHPVYEPPTRRILARCLSDEPRHVAAGAVVLERLLANGERGRAESWEVRLLEALGEAGGVTGQTPAPSRALDAPGVDPVGDLVALDSAFDARVIAPDLREAIDTHVRALATGDRAAFGAQVAEEVRDAVLATYAQVSAGPDYEVVAQAKVGAYRLIKLRLTGPRGPRLLLQQWRSLGGAWRVVAVDLLGVPPGT
jgi:hypothetical protein